MAEGTQLTLIDTGLPRLWEHLCAALDDIGRSVSDIAAVLITHAHLDHMGLASRVQQHSGAAIWVHRADADLAAQPMDAETVLPGHGEPWSGGLASAARAAIEHGLH